MASFRRHENIFSPACIFTFPVCSLQSVCFLFLFLLLCLFLTLKGFKSTRKLDPFGS